MLVYCLLLYGPEDLSLAGGYTPSEIFKCFFLYIKSTRMLCCAQKCIIMSYF